MQKAKSITTSKLSSLTLTPLTIPSACVFASQADRLSHYGHTVMSGAATQQDLEHIHEPTKSQEGWLGQVLQHYGTTAEEDIRLHAVVPGRMGMTVTATCFARIR